jgi:D-alanyl-D-alanine endopeptidase (penicillin-binding protein 7)
MLSLTADFCYLIAAGTQSAGENDTKAGRVMDLKRKAWRVAVCASSVMAMLALAPVHAADGKKRVHVKYASKSSVKGVKTPVRKGRPVSRDNAALARADFPSVKSAAVLVVDLDDGRTIFGKNTQSITPIASITKLMTAMVVLDAGLPLEETLYIDSADLDFVKHTNSRLGVGTGLPRRDMLRLALMSSENRAAASLGREYPGGGEAFIAAMNRKAVELGMWNTRFVDPTGLSSENVSTANDLVKMVKGAYQYPLIREFTTTSEHEVGTMAGRNLHYRNSNGLVRNSDWEIGLSKTGYISEAGRCLVMQARIAARQVIIVLLDSWGKQTRIGDANRIKKWMETHNGRRPLG